MDHFVEILDDREMAKQLTLSRILDAKDLEEVLRAHQRAKTHQVRVMFGSNKLRQNIATSPDRGHVRTQ